MSDSIASDPKRRELEELLPFYANGRIAEADKRRVESALAADPELAARLDIIRDDMAETVLLNESLGAPSPRALEKLMAEIEAAPRPAPLLARAKDSIGQGFLGWLAGLLASQPPRRLAYASAAAIALIALQGLAITGLAIRDGGAGFQTASAPGALASERYVLLSFAPEAKAGEIAAFFKRFDASVVDGPRANGFFKVRVGDASLSSAQVDAIAARMKSESAIVNFVAPAP
ncbi:anti-sigma factor family protein [Bosea sp. CER48]|uniref:anti-sigma factor family protein n=1 Tax=Bosea sp. CER48 TaxID=3377035 RepID=UPI00382FFDA2